MIEDTNSLDGAHVVSRPAFGISNVINSYDITLTIDKCQLTPE